MKPLTIGCSTALKKSTLKKITANFIFVTFWARIFMVIFIMYVEVNLDSDFEICENIIFSDFQDAKS